MHTAAAASTGPKTCQEPAAIRTRPQRPQAVTVLPLLGEAASSRKQPALGPGGTSTPWGAGCSRGHAAPCWNRVQPS